MTLKWKFLHMANPLVLESSSTPRTVSVDFKNVTWFFPAILTASPEICDYISSFIMTRQFDLSYYHLSNNCGTRSLLSLGVSRRQLEIFTKIVKINFYSDLLGYHSLAQRQSAWTIESMAIAIRHFRLDCALLVKQDDDYYLQFPAKITKKDKIQCIYLESYHYSVREFPLRFLITCNQMHDTHYLLYGYGKNYKNPKKFLATKSDKVRLPKDSRQILKVEDMPNYGYDCDNLKEDRRRDYNKKKFRKILSKYSSTAFSSFLPKIEKVFSFDTAHDCVQFVLDLLFSFSTIRDFTVIEIVRSTYLFLRTRGIELKDFMFTLQDFSFYKFLNLSNVSLFSGKKDPDCSPIRKLPENWKEQKESIEKTIGRKISMFDFLKAFELPSKEEETKSPDVVISPPFSPFPDVLPSPPTKRSTFSFSGTVGTEINPEEPDLSFLSKVKDTFLWPFVSQLFVSLLALACAKTASCVVSKERLSLVNACILQSCNKLDVFGVVRVAMEFLQSKFPFVAKVLPGYQYQLDQAYARSQYYKVLCSTSVENIALSFKDYFQTGEEYYESIVELINNYPRFFTVKEMIGLNDLKAKAFGALQNGKPRMPPFSVGLIGGSAQGKTTCINRLKAVFSSVYKEESLPDEYTMFSLNVADSYVSGYTNQDMIVFDDAGATKPEFSPNSELSFILQAINGINTPTLQAGVDNKGKVYFKNTSFVITSNHKHFGATQTMTCPQAVLRRLNLIAEVRIDQTKLEDDKIVDCYIITPYSVTIKRNTSDFAQEGFEYTPVLGFDEDFVPRTCSWSYFESLVYDRSLEFKKQQELLMKAMTTVRFCKECKTTFCLCDELKNLTVDPGSNLNPFSLHFDKKIDTTSNDIIPSLPIHPLVAKSLKPKPLSHYVGKSYSTFSSTMASDFIIGFGLCSVLSFIMWNFHTVIERGLEMAGALNEAAKALDSVFDKGISYYNAFLRMRTNAKQKVLDLRVYWERKYQRLRNMLELSPAVKTILYSLIGGVIGVLAGSAIFRLLQPSPTRAVVPEQRNEIKHVSSSLFASRAILESVPSKTSTTEVKQKKVFDNIWRVRVFNADGLTSSVVSMLAIGGKHCLIVNHFAKTLIPGLSVVLTRERPGFPSNVIKTTSSHFRVLEQFPDSDLALVLVNSLPLAQDITPYISREIPESLLLWRAPKESELFAVSPIFHVDSEPVRIQTDVASPRCFRYQSMHPIERGHCGSLVVCAKTQNIVGIVVGSADQDRTVGLFVPVPMINFKPQVVDVDIPLSVGGKHIGVRDFDLGKLKYSSVHSVLEVVGRTDSYPRPSVTKVKRTVLDESVEKLVDPKGIEFGVRHKPTPELDPIKIGGYRPQMGKAVSRALTVLEDVGQPFEAEELRYARVQYTTRVAKTLQDFTPEDLKIPSRVLTPEEGVLGKYDGRNIPGVNPMVINTSAGFPSGGLKSDFISRQDDVVLFDPEFHQELLKKIEQLKRGERIQSFSVACLKDEVVKITKEKSRLFYIVDLYNTLLARCVFAPLISFCSQFPFLSECAQGVNNHSTQWGDMFDFLSEVGTDFCFDGDYTDYDLTMPREVILETFEFIFWFLGWCGFDQENLLMAKTLSQELTEPNVFMGPILYRWYRGWISGNVLTFINNSISNSIIDRTTYRALTGRTDFDVQVRTIKGGDDVITSYSGVDRRYNMIAIMQYLREKGFIYTSAMKDGNSVEYKPLTECQFFKRGFVRDKDKMLSPIDPNSIVKMLTWTDSDNLHEQTLGSVESALREAYHYGADYFSHFSNSLREVCERTSILRGTVGTYGQYIGVLGYFNYQRYDDQFKRLPAIKRDFPNQVDSEEASHSDSSIQSGYDRTLSP